METVFEKAQRLFPFEKEKQIIFIMGADTQKQLDINAAACAFEWYLNNGQHLSRKKAIEMFKNRFYGALNNEKWQ